MILVSGVESSDCNFLDLGSFLVVFFFPNFLKRSIFELNIKVQIPLDHCVLAYAWISWGFC